MLCSEVMLHPKLIFFTCAKTASWRRGTGTAAGKQYFKDLDVSVCCMDVFVYIAMCKLMCLSVCAYVHLHVFECVCVCVCECMHANGCGCLQMCL